MGGPTRADQAAPMPGATEEELGSIRETLGGMVATLAGMASKADVAGKASLADLAGRAASADLAALVAVVAGKASAGDLVALAGNLGGKASADALLALSNTVAGKAAAADVTAAAARLLALENGRALAADLIAAVARIATIEGALPGKATVDALAAAVARIGAVEAALATVPQFVQAATMTVEELLVTYPAAAVRRGKYARVSNYAGYVDRVLRCDFDANLQLYFWAPTLAEYGRTIAVTGNMSLKRLLSPTSIILSGAIPLGTTRELTIETTNGRPGEIVEIKAMPVIGGTLNVLGTGLGSAVAVAAGAYQKYLIDGSSGALQLVRLI